VPFYSDRELTVEPGVPSWQPDGQRDVLPIVPFYSDRELLIEPGVPSRQPGWVTRHSTNCSFLFR
jgi:hypothetical protein